jgi:ATP-dependent Lhr-like helicase
MKECPCLHFTPSSPDGFANVSHATDVQSRSWPEIRSGSDVLIAAPTGSGKTLAAFLTCIDELLKQSIAGELEDKTQVVYVSPLKGSQQRRSEELQQPLSEIAAAAWKPATLRSKSASRCAPGIRRWVTASRC